jgi:hypothetical protein
VGEVQDVHEAEDHGQSGGKQKQQSAERETRQEDLSELGDCA